MASEESAILQTYAAATLARHLEQLLKQEAGVRAGDDPECIHDARVASRRLRNALRMFRDDLPAKRGKQWRRWARDVTRGLGPARDLDVRIEFLIDHRGELDNGAPSSGAAIDRLLLRLRQTRQHEQRPAVVTMERCARSKKRAALQAWIQAHASDAPPPRAGGSLRNWARSAIQLRLEHLAVHSLQIADPAAIEAHHALRIAVKHLRYALEVCEPLAPTLIKQELSQLRRMQTLLGDLHDCDVWIAYLPQFTAEERERHVAHFGTPAGFELFAQGLQTLSGVFARRREMLHAETLTSWRAWSTPAHLDALLTAFNEPAAPTAAEPAAPQPLAAAPTERAAEALPTAKRQPDSAQAAGDPPRLRVASRIDERGFRFTEEHDERLAPVLQLAEACAYEAEHAHQVTRVALQLFDQTEALHALPDDDRFFLLAGGLLHDIGWLEGAAAHHKTALRMIMNSELLAWEVRERRIVGLVARYHRKSPPRTGHAEWDALEPADQERVRSLAALLRIADGLDYRHESRVTEVDVLIAAPRISIHVVADEEVETELTRASRKADLFEMHFGRRLELRWRPGIPTTAIQS